jgi:hypothetical protein
MRWRLCASGFAGKPLRTSPCSMRCFGTDDKREMIIYL